MPTEITLKQISNLSGFSISTVSKALNDKLDISNKTRVKIQKLAKNFNYVPNNSALALKSRKTKIIAVIVPQINSSLYSNMISSIQEKAFHQGYRILLLQSLKSEEIELECINNVRDGCVDGIIIIKSFQKREYSKNKLSSVTNSLKLPTIIEKMDRLNISTDKGYIIGEKLLTMLLNKIEQRYKVLTKKTIIA